MATSQIILLSTNVGRLTHDSNVAQLATESGGNRPLGPVMGSTHAVRSTSALSPTGDGAIKRDNEFAKWMDKKTEQGDNQGD